MSKERIKKRHDALGRVLVKNAERIRGILRHSPTPQIVHHCHNIFRHAPREASEKFGLKSPFKQGSYLLGQLLVTPESERTRELTNKELQKLNELLEVAADNYPLLFFPTSKELAELKPDEREKFALTGPAFLGHYFTGILATSEQVLELTRMCFSPFDEELQSAIGISGSVAVDVIEFLHAAFQSKLDQLVDGYRVLFELWKDGVPVERAREEMVARNVTMPDPLLLERGEIAEAFGLDVENSFWTLMVGYRGSSKMGSFTYFAEPNPYDYYPLIGDGLNRAYCPLANNLGLGLTRALTDELSRDPRIRERFFSNRDSVLENKVEALFRSFFGPASQVFSSLSEDPGGRFEHDVIVVWGKTLLCVEAKASPPEMPFRDTERSFRRLRGAFRSDGGIQKAFDQAIRLVRRLRSGNPVQLYHLDGTLAFSSLEADIEEVWPICVTADSWGVMATDLSLLLDKQVDDPYPWAVNVFDLETFFEGLSLKNWGPEEFLSFLRQRVARHGQIVAGDELEIAGMFLRHGRLPEVPENAFIQVEPSYSDIFDDIFLWKNGAGPSPDLSTNDDMVVTNLTPHYRSVIEEMQRRASLLH